MFSRFIRVIRRCGYGSPTGVPDSTLRRPFSFSGHSWKGFQARNRRGLTKIYRLYDGFAGIQSAAYRGETNESPGAPAFLRHSLAPRGRMGLFRWDRKRARRTLSAGSTDLPAEPRRFTMWLRFSQGAIPAPRTRTPIALQSPNCNRNARAGGVSSKNFP